MIDPHAYVITQAHRSVLLRHKSIYSGTAVIEPKNISPVPGRPLYVVVRDAVRAAIDAGRYVPGEQLPSTKALSQRMNVSLVTAHRALQELVVSGVLRRGQGKGTYVHEDYGRDSRRGLGLRFGLVFQSDSSLADAYNGLIFEGVRREANELGIDLVLLRYGEDWRNECNAYLFVNPFEEQLQRPIRAGKKAGESEISPVMVVGATFSLPGVRCIDTDNIGIATSAANYLAELGHKEVAFIGGNGKVSNDRDRQNGFMSACQHAQLSLRPERIFRNDIWRLNAENRVALENELQRPDRPTAIFAAGYHFALDAFSAASAVGLRVPQDISVISVDDPPSASFLSPPLTTFRQQLIEMGRAAVRETFDGLKEEKTEGKSEVKSEGKRADKAVTLLPAEFVERLSCATVKPNTSGGFQSIASIPTLVVGGLQSDALHIMTREVSETPAGKQA